jgi:hypothetical protein
MIREIEKKALSGWGYWSCPALLIVGPSASSGGQSERRCNAAPILTAVVLSPTASAGRAFLVNPGSQGPPDSAACGTVKAPGLRWANPLQQAPHLAAHQNFETLRLKVNDSEGNPIEIAAVVGKVVDTAEACFEVDDYNNYVHVQSEAALRNLSTSYAYDSHVENQMSLRANTAEVAAHLKTEIQDRLAKAGVETIEARISHLAYAPEIAAAMLQRQQASAIIAARTRIVEGAVGMVEMALERLDQKDIVHLDEDGRRPW